MNSRNRFLALGFRILAAVLILGGMIVTLPSASWAAGVHEIVWTTPSSGQAGTSKVYLVGSGFRPVIVKTE